MQLIFCDKDPREAARALCDQHCRRKLVEALQLLSNCHHLYGPERIRFVSSEGKYDGVVVKQLKPYLKQRDGEYALIYKKHRASASLLNWLRDSAANYEWLYQHADELVDECQRRFGKSPDVIPILRALSCPPSEIGVKIKGLTVLRWPDLGPSAAPLEPCTAHAQVVAHYRDRYQQPDIRDLAVWTNRRPPGWWAIPVTLKETKHGQQYQSSR